MKTLKPKTKYQAISLPKELIDDIKDIVMKNHSYRSISEFARTSIRNQIVEEKRNIKIG